MICCFLTTPAQQKPSLTLVDTRLKQVRTSVITAKKADSSADTTEWENQIDQKVYELYGLTEDEIAIVEGK